MAYYKDLRAYLSTLEDNGKLFKVLRPIQAETELMPLVRLQFRGLREDRRRGFLFENVQDARGKTGRAAVAIYAPSRDVYALGLMCAPDEIAEKWANALLHPIEPQMVESGPVQEVVQTGEELEREGMESILLPVELPGFSGQIRTTTHFITKDPDTGARNIGTYSGHVCGPTTIGWQINRRKGGYLHWKKCKEKGKPLQAAIVIGALPHVAFTASAEMAHGVDELAVSGGLVGEPVPLVKCKTVDLEVPANAEIVIEGEISTEYMIPLSSFGEFTGYMFKASDADSPVMNVTCITRRKDPISVHLFSQMPPSESSKMRQTSSQNIFYKFLKHGCGIPGVIDVTFPEMGGSSAFCVIRMKKFHPGNPWQALNCAAGYSPGIGKVFIVVDEDIDPKDPDSVMWALSYRMQPHRDIRITMGKSPGLDPSGYPPGASKEDFTYPQPSGTSAMLVDATRKYPYPPVALPSKDYMDRAIRIWEDEKLPQLSLRTPWFGYELGNWDDEDRTNAALIVRGEYGKVGERLLAKKERV